MSTPYPFTVTFDGKPTPARLNGPGEVSGLYLDLPPGEYFVGLGCGMDVIEQLGAQVLRLREVLGIALSWLNTHQAGLGPVQSVLNEALTGHREKTAEWARDREDAEKWRALQAFAADELAGLSGESKR